MSSLPQLLYYTFGILSILIGIFLLFHTQRNKIEGCFGLLLILFFPLSELIQNFLSPWLAFIVLQAVYLFFLVALRSSRINRLPFHDQFWKELYEWGPNPLFILGEDWKIQQANHRAMKVLRKTRSQLEFTPLWSHFDNDGIFKTMDLGFMLENRLPKEGRFSIEVKLITALGEKIPYQMQISRFSGYKGQKKPFILCEATNIQERKEAESVLRDSEERLRTFANHFPGAVYQMDLVKKSVYYYGMVENLTGYAPEALSQHNPQFEDLIHPEDRERYKLRTQESLYNGKQEVEMEYRLLHPTGRVKWIRELRQILREREAKFIQGTLYDISEIKKRELTLIQTQKLQALGRLTSGIAHDFNNQLMVISALTEYLEMKVEPELKDVVARIQNSIDASTDLTSRLLVFSRSDGQKKGRVNINNLLKESAPLIEKLIGSGVLIQLNLCSQEVFLNLSQSRLEQCLINLSINAKDSMEGDGEIRIKTMVKQMKKREIPQDREAGLFLVLEFSDTGMGMEDSTLEQIFEPFFSTKSLGNGTGLGLSLVYGFVQDAGGFIKVHSQVNKGSRFSLYFPINQ